MKLKKNILALALTLTFIASGSLCTSVSAEEKAAVKNTIFLNFITSGEKAYNEARYEEAERLCNEAMKEAKGPKGDNVMLVRGLIDLSTITMNQGKYTEAENYCKEALEAIEKDPTMGSESANMAMVMNNFAALYASLSRMDEAETFYKQAIEVGEKLYGKTSPNVAIGWLNLGQLYYDWGKYKESREVLEHALSTFKTPESKATMFYAVCLHHMGEVNRLEGNYKLSEQYFKQAISEAATSIGKNHPYYAGAMQNLGELYTRLGRYKEAETLYNDALAIYERQPNPEFPGKAKIWHELAFLYEEQGKYAQAEEMCKKALELREKIFGKKHGEYAASLNCLATIYASEGKYTEAEPLLKECLSIRERVYGIDNPKSIRTLKNLGSLYTDEDKLELAETTLNKALKYAERKFKPDHADITDIVRELTEVYEKQNKIVEAIPMSQRALASLEKNFGPTSVRYAEGLREVASLTVKQNKFKEALAMYKKALTIDEKELGANSTTVAKDLSALAHVYTLMKDTANAKEAEAKAEKIKATLPGNKYSNEVSEAFKNNQRVVERPFKPVGNKYALVVGISNFEDKSINLRYAAKDATDFANFLTTRGNFKADNVKLLTDENATRQGIIDALGKKWLGSKANSNDLVIIYVSSHGSPAKEEANKNNFLVAYDTNKNSLLATGIPMQWLSQIIKDEVRSDRIVLVLDVCHSGAARQGEKTLFREPGINMRNVTFGAGQSILCSSLADQVSWESKKYPNSVFTKRLIEGLVSQGDKTTLVQAYEYIKDKVESEVMTDRGERQTPILDTSLWEGDNVMIAVPLESQSKDKVSNK